jgi:hypothetical protein
MKKGLLGGIGLAVVIVAGLICIAKCTVRVPAGYIAVEYKMNGGISKNVLTQGWHVISPTVKTSLYSVGIESLILHLRIRAILQKMKVSRHQRQMENRFKSTLNFLINSIRAE